MENVLSFLLYVQWGKAATRGQQACVSPAQTPPHPRCCQQPRHFLQALPGAFSSCPLCNPGLTALPVPLG